MLLVLMWKGAIDGMWGKICEQNEKKEKISSISSWKRTPCRKGKYESKHISFEQTFTYINCDLCVYRLPKSLRQKARTLLQLVL